MTSHLHDRLGDIPVPPLQLESIIRRGERLRRGRRTLTVFASSATAAIVVAGLLTLADALRLQSDPSHKQGPAAPATETVDLHIFLKDDITPKQRRNVREVAEDVQGVLNVRHISRRGAYNEFKEHYRDRPEFWENLPPDALPARFVVTFQDESYVATARQRLSQLAGVDEVRPGQGENGEEDSSP